MRLTRCHLPGAWRTGDCVPLPRTQADHLVKVLRLRPGASIELFDGEGRACRGVLEAGARGSTLVRIQAPLQDEPLPRVRFALLQSLARGEKMDWIVQKATELGVSLIQPVAADHSVVRLDRSQMERKLEHWRAIALSACEQCGRNRAPRIETPAPLADLPFAGQALWTLDPDASVSLAAAAREWRGAHAATAVEHARALPESTADIHLLIGPEGGLSAAENALLEARGARRLRLGPRILRTETAALAALAVLQSILGDLDDC